MNTFVKVKSPISVGIPTLLVSLTAHASDPPAGLQTELVPTVIPGGNREVLAAEHFHSGQTEHIYTGGEFGFVGGKRIPYIAQWDGNDWKLLGDGLNGPLADMVVFGDGSGEANPIARAVIDAGPTSLVSFKVASIACSSALLLVAARRLAGEVGAWTAFVIMASVMVVWAQYLPLAEVDGMELVCDASFRRW